MTSPSRRPVGFWLTAPLLALVSSALVVALIHKHVFSGLVPTKISTLYENDQLGYLAIVTNVAHGYSPSLEPDTISGQNPYPSAYYTLVGWTARLLGLEPVTAWNVVSLGLQTIALALLGVTVACLARRAVAAVLAPLTVLTGCFAWVSTGSWLIPINHQGALWGPFGVLFPMNGETAGLSAIIAGISLLGLAWGRPGVPPGHRAILTALASVSLGVSANFQTYGFLAGTFVVGCVLAAIALWRARAVVSALVSVVLLVVVALAGPAVAEAIGSLGTLVFGLLPMVPGALVLVRLGGWKVLAYPLLFALSAAPMVLSTLAAQDTPFMRYRVTSNVALGVTSWESIAASAFLLIVMAVILVLGILARSAVAAGVGSGFPIAWALVSLNDLWGANAEPYRFWIDAHLLGLVLALVALSVLWGRRRAAAKEGTSAREEAAASSAPRPRGLRPATIAIVLVWALSLGDVSWFLRDTNVASTWDPGTPQSRQIVEAVGTIEPGDGRLWATSCQDLRRIKVLTGAPVAFYHLGMAWPDDRDEVQAVMDAASQRTIDVGLLRSADVRWVLTQEGCDPIPPAGLEPVRTVGDLTLWEVSA